MLNLHVLVCLEVSRCVSSYVCVCMCMCVCRYVGVYVPTRTRTHVYH